jgi:hypothetical protein
LTSMIYFLTRFRANYTNTFNLVNDYDYKYFSA